MPREKIAGVNGAGDAFAAGALYGWHEGFAILDCLRLGHACAAASMREVSTTTGVATVSECLAARRALRAAAAAGLTVTVGRETRGGERRSFALGPLSLPNRVHPPRRDRLERRGPAAGPAGQPLNGRGREQASAVGRMLARRMRAEIDRLEAADAFVASPLMRTRDTMELARAAMGFEPKSYGVCDELKELTFGEWEGLTWLMSRPPSTRKRERARRTSGGFAPPGGESYAALAERIAPGWRPPGDMFMASHGGVARALMYLLGGLDPQIRCECRRLPGTRAGVRAGGRGVPTGWDEAQRPNH